MQVPEGRGHARVQNGWVTLDGEVDYDYQRHEVSAAAAQHDDSAREPGNPGARGDHAPCFARSLADTTRLAGDTNPVNDPEVRGSLAGVLGSFPPR